MMPARNRISRLALSRLIAARAAHQSAVPPDTASTDPEKSADNLSGSARLFADAEEEESREAESSRRNLTLSQGEIWTGDENQVDAVLRMLVDAHRPLRSGDALGSDTADKKIRGMLKNLKLEPREGMIPSSSSAKASAEDEVKVGASEDGVTPHRTKLPPHLHRPWHSTYTGSVEIEETAPNVKYGMFIRKKATGEDLSNIMELQLPPGADGKTRAKIRDARRSHRTITRLGGAREGAIDYRLSQSAGEMGEETADNAEIEDETFTGNRQTKGSSVLGAQKGAASGLRAWAGLVEDRIQRARESGFLTATEGRGKPIPRDENAGNPHLDTGELLMNRIVKRQGALPPWIEMQNNLDNAHNAFRTTLKETYIKNLVRTVISTNTLNPLPPEHTIPDRDEAWEAREKKFHEENVKQLNELIRKMNAQAPAPARRHLTTLELELGRVRGEPLKSAVWEEIQRRAEEYKTTQANTRPSSPYFMESEGLSKLKNATKRSLWTIAHPVRAVLGKAKGGGSGAAGYSERNAGSSEMPADENHGGESRMGLFFVAGLGVAGLIYFRRPTQNESQSNFDHLVPLHQPPPSPSSPSHIVATSPAEPTMGPIRFIRLYIIEPIMTFVRFIHLAVLFGPVIITAPMLMIGKPERRKRGKPVADDEENWGAVWWYGFLVKQMERAGPSFIKLGQWAASRADLFPASLCDLMSKLHSNGQPHPFKHTKKVIETAFGLRFEEVFEEFKEDPIGCGAIAQVYRAKLKQEILPVDAHHDHSKHSADLVPTTSVAIKVLHPRVRQIVRRDIAIMSVFANIINAFPGMEWISLPEEVQVFGEMMNSQLDLRVEASNLEMFEKNFLNRGARVVFPKPIKLGKMGNGESREESREVLMEEFEDALPLKYFLRNGGGPYDDKIANIGLDAFLEMLLLDNWTHGDLHPGNIMVRFYRPTSSDIFAPLLSRFSKAEIAPEDSVPEHSLSADALVHSLTAVSSNQEEWLSKLEDLDQKGYEPQLIFIDAGLITSLDKKNRRDFLDLFQAVAEFDGYKAGKLMVERCRTPQHVIDEETFALKIQHLVLSVKSKTFSLAKIKISDILTDVLLAVRQHHVKLEGDFVNTVISILLLEGIGRQLDPDMDLFKAALPILRQVGRQMGTREAISQVPKGNILAMIKLWFWIEARQVAGEASGVDSWIKYDRLMPAV